MKVYHALAKDRTDYAKSQLKPSHGTIAGMLERTESYKKQLESLDEDLAQLGNKYISDYNLSKIDIDEIRIVNKSLLEEFVSVFNNRSV